MNYSNITIVISSLLIASLFFAAVFISINIKEEKKELDRYKDKITELELKIKRQKIEINTLTNPKFVINYIEKNNMKPVGLNKIETIVIKGN